MKIKRLIILCFIFGEVIFQFPLLAQKITTFKRSNGLVDNYVYSVIQAREPRHIWVGTREGVGIYDGKMEWAKFAQNDSLINQKVNAILQDSNENFWFGTENGMSKFDGEQWTHYPNQSMPSNILVPLTKITCLFLDSKNNIWIGTRGRGVIKYFVNNEDEQWEHYYTGCPGIMNITAINEDSKGNMWFGTLDSSVCKFDGDTSWTHYREIESVGNRINVIFKDQSGTLWIGSNSGVSSTIDGSQWDNSKVENVPSIQAIVEDREGTIWFATDDGVLYKYDRISCYKSSVQLESRTRITLMIQDSAGYVWLGTEGNGISRLHLNWQLFDKDNSGLEDNYIMGIAEDRDGNLWIATDSNDIFKYDCIMFERKYVSLGWEGMNEVNSILVDKDNYIWCATENGVHRFDGKNKWDSFLAPQHDLADNIVKTVFQDQNGKIWVGTRNGVSRFDGQFKTISTLPSITINAIWEDHIGHLWFGTAGKGVFEFVDDSVIINFNTSNGMIDNDVTAIIQDKDDVYWFATRDGISKWDRENNRWTTVTEESGLHHNYVQSLFKDHSNNIWVGTYDGGISKFDGKFWWDFSSNVVSDEIYSIFQDSKENFWFGTTVGVLKFIPDNNGPETVITFSPTGTIGVASALFNFIGFDTETPKETLVYAWEIRETNSPLPHNWSAFHKKTYCHVGLLLNGTYTFFVKAKDSEDNEDKTPAQSRPFTVDITPPTTIINYPRSSEVISEKVTIIGTAIDESPIKDFKHYWLEYAKMDSISSTDRLVWEKINDVRSSSVRDSTLLIWDVTELNGLYYLRLSAEDSLGHISETRIPVKIVETLENIQKNEGGQIKSFQNKVYLYIPPGTLKKDTIIHLSPVETSEISIADNLIKKSPMAYRIGPADEQLNKPATLTFLYDDYDIIKEETKLSLLHYVSNNEYELLGGYVNTDKNTIQTVTKKLGTFILVEDNTIKARQHEIDEVNCQPRIFSPRGTGLSTTTTISFKLKGETEITIKVYNMAGRLVRVILNNELLSTPYNALEWDGRDYNGDICPSDLYIVIIESKKVIKKKTVIILDKTVE